MTGLKGREKVSLDYSSPKSDALRKRSDSCKLDPQRYLARLISLGHKGFCVEKKQCI